MQDDCLDVSNKPFISAGKKLIPPPRGASFRTSKNYADYIHGTYNYYGGAVINFTVADWLAWFDDISRAVSLTLGSGPVITTNNTVILITAIAEDTTGGGPSRLTCHTDLTACCRSVKDNNGNGGLGQWTYPNGSVILNNDGSTAAGQLWYINRDAAKLIRLSRREGNNPLTPTGSYCCTVPTTGGEMTLCANLGEWICNAD